jgi:hypothetical protein
MTPRIAAFVLLMGSLLMGFAQVAQLPPWEGFDETTHYSYLQQLAETGRWPRFADPIAADINDYVKVAPTTSSLSPPWNYRNFFSAPPETIARGRAAIHDPNRERAWRPGEGWNWQAQHPPLYYLLISPAYLASKDWSLSTQLFVLRAVSYVVAWLALCLATCAAWRSTVSDPVIRCSLFLAPALWPVVFPMWFPEMARLGNDSLVALLAAGAWWVLTRMDAKPGGIRDHAVLGLICGLGLLTKATFLPLLAAVALFLCYRAWQAKTVPIRLRLRGPVLFLAMVAAIAGWWYVNKYLETGHPIGGNDAIHLERAGGLLQGLQQHWSLREFVRGIPTLLYGFLWAGTWSFALPPGIMFIPLTLMSFLLAGGYLWSLAVTRPEPVEWIPPLTLALFLAALINQLLIYIASGGQPGVPGWYLHSLMALFALPLGRSIAVLVGQPFLRTLLWAALCYVLLFVLVAFTINGLFYAGCGTSPFVRIRLEYVTLFACLGDLPTVLARLSMIGFPLTAGVLFVAGWVLLWCGMIASLWMLSRTASPRAR